MSITMSVREEVAITSSQRTQRQVHDYQILLPRLQRTGVDLSAIPKLLEDIQRNTSKCNGDSYTEAAALLQKWFETNDYEALTRHLTDPCEEYDKYRVVSPLITVFRERLDPKGRRITRASLSGKVRG